LDYHTDWLLEEVFKFLKGAFPFFAKKIFQEKPLPAHDKKRFALRVFLKLNFDAGKEEEDHDEI